MTIYNEKEKSLMDEVIGDIQVTEREMVAAADDSPASAMTSNCRCK